MKAQLDVLNEFTVPMFAAVTTVGALLVSTVGPVLPIFEMADDRLLKSEESAVERLLNPLVTSLVSVLTDVCRLEIEVERLLNPLVTSPVRVLTDTWRVEIEDAMPDNVF